MVRHVEGLTVDRDKLSIDLADKAETIRKLLEDNKVLHNQLATAKCKTNEVMDAVKLDAMQQLQDNESIPVRDSSDSAPNIENNQRVINTTMV